MSIQNAKVVPYKVRVHKLIIMDTVTKYGKDVKNHTQKVTASNLDKSYNLYNPFNKSTDDVEGVVRKMIRNALLKIANNPYESAELLFIGNEKLPKNVNALRGFLDPLINDCADMFPFPQDFSIFSEDVVIEVEVSEDQEKETQKQEQEGVGEPEGLVKEKVVGQSKIQGIDMQFKDFVNIDGWSEVDTSQNMPEIKLTVCIKVACGSMPQEEHIHLLDKLYNLINSIKGNSTLAYLLSSEDQNFNLIKELVNEDFSILTTSSSLDSASWLPASKTALTEKVFSSLNNNAGDLLFVK